MNLVTLNALLKARSQKTPTALVTDLNGGAQTLVTHDSVDGDLALRDDQVAAARQALMHDKAVMIDDDHLFAQPHNPPKRLIVVGAVHVAQPLAPMARIAGFEVIVVDPRRAFATKERFPDVTLVDAWPDEGLTGLAPDERTAVVVLTHDPKLDDPALTVALASPAFYIGALGSRKTHAGRLGRLREAGLDEDALARIHAPIGLAIGGRSPAEIGLAILAQITAVLHGVQC